MVMMTSPKTSNGPISELMWSKWPHDQWKFWFAHLFFLVCKLICVLKGTYYEKNTFPWIWGVVLGLWCSHTHLKKGYLHDFWVRYAFLKAPRLQLPNKQVSFGAPSYVGRGHIWILPPTSPSPSNQSIAKILWTSGRALGGDVIAGQGVRRSCRKAAGSFGGSSAAPAGELQR